MCVELLLIGQGFEVGFNGESYGGRRFIRIVLGQVHGPPLMLIYSNARNVAWSTTKFAPTELRLRFLKCQALPKRAMGVSEGSQSRLKSNGD